MAETKRSKVTVPQQEVVKAAAVSLEETSDFLLPTEPSVVSDNIHDYFFYIHGIPKIGKTSLATQEGDTLLITFDPPNKSVPLLQVYCPDWSHVAGYLTELQRLAHWAEVEPQNYVYPYKKVVLDGIDLMYRYCQTWCEKKLVVNHIGQEGFSRGWDLLHYTFRTTVQQYMALPGGCWFISHSEWKEIKTRRGSEGTKLVPDAKGYAGKVVSALADGLFAYDYNGRERVLIVRGDENTGAGCKIDGRFLTPNGRQVEEVPMGGSVQDAWKNFMRAFNNQQVYVNLDERDRMRARQVAGKETKLPNK